MFDFYPTKSDEFTLLNLLTVGKYHASGPINKQEDLVCDGTGSLICSYDGSSDVPIFCKNKLEVDPYFMKYSITSSTSYTYSCEPKSTLDCSTANTRCQNIKGDFIDYFNINNVNNCLANEFLLEYKCYSEDSSELVDFYYNSLYLNPKYKSPKLQLLLDETVDNDFLLEFWFFPDNSSTLLSDLSEEGSKFARIIQLCNSSSQKIYFDYIDSELKLNIEGGTSTIISGFSLGKWNRFILWQDSTHLNYIINSQVGAIEFVMSGVETITFKDDTSYFQFPGFFRNLEHYNYNSAKDINIADLLRLKYSYYNPFGTFFKDLVYGVPIINKTRRLFTLSSSPNDYKFYPIDTSGSLDAIKVKVDNSDVKDYVDEEQYFPFMFGNKFLNDEMATAVKDACAASFSGCKLCNATTCLACNDDYTMKVKLEATSVTFYCEIIDNSQCTISKLALIPAYKKTTGIEQYKDPIIRKYSEIKAATTVLTVSFWAKIIGVQDVEVDTTPIHLLTIGDKLKLFFDAKSTNKKLILTFNDTTDVVFQESSQNSIDFFQWSLISFTVDLAAKKAVISIGNNSYSAIDATELPNTWTFSSDKVEISSSTFIGFFSNAKIVTRYIPYFPYVIMNQPEEDLIPFARFEIGYCTSDSNTYEKIEGENSDTEVYYKCFNEEIDNYCLNNGFPSHEMVNNFATKFSDQEKTGNMHTFYNAYYFGTSLDSTTIKNSLKGFNYQKITGSTSVSAKNIYIFLIKILVNSQYGSI